MMQLRLLATIWVAAVLSIAIDAHQEEGNRLENDSVEAEVWQTQFSQIWPGGESHSQETSEIYASPEPNIGYLEELPGSLRLSLRAKAVEPGAKGVLAMLGLNKGKGCGENLRIIYSDPEGGHGLYGVDIGANDRILPLMSDKTYELGTSVAVDVTFEAKSKTVQLFVNGVPQGKAVWDVEMPPKGSLSVLPNCADMVQKFTNGEVSDVRVYAGSAMPRPPFFSLPEAHLKPDPVVTTLESIPQKIRVHFRFSYTPDSPNGALVLVGGEKSNCAQSLQLALSRKDSAETTASVVFGVEGRRPHALEAPELKPDTTYVVDASYDHQTREAQIFIDHKLAASKEDLWGGDELRGKSLWQYPDSGAVSILSACHLDRSTAEAKVSDVRLYSGVDLPGGDIRKVDCEIAEWGDWGSCSRDCGGGQQQRKREVLVDDRNGGTSCPNTHETRRCNTQGCAIERCFEGDGITSECQFALEGSVAARPTGASKSLLGFGQGSKDGLGWPEDVNTVDSRYASQMAAMHTPTAAAAAWSTEVKEDVEEGELRRQKTKLSVVYVADSHNNNILRWDAATNRAETIVEEAITPPATTEGEVAADAENEAEAGKEKQSIGAVTVEHFSGNRVFFAAGSRIKAFDAATDAVATVVGDGQFGSCEPGLGTQVRFGGSTAMAVTPSSNDNSVLIYGDASGALMVWDSVSKKVAVLAGKCGVSGHQDGHAINDARLGSKIQGIALDTIEAANGAPMLRAVYFTDASSHTVRRLQWVPAVRGTRLQGVLVDALLSEENAAKAVVTTIAGTPMQAGYVDTQAEKSALFNSPGSVGLAHTGLAAERRTSVYVADQANGVVRVVDPVEQSASTLISLAHTSSFELSSDSKALALSTQEARLYQVDMHSVVNCDEMMRALHLSFKNWVVDEEADIFKEQSLSATATLELPDAQRLGRSRFNIRFYKKVKHVASVEVPDESAGQLDKYLICTSEKAAGAEAPQDCCVRKYATPVKGKQWESKEADLALW